MIAYGNPYYKEEFQSFYFDRDLLVLCGRSKALGIFNGDISYRKNPIKTFFKASSQLSSDDGFIELELESLEKDSNKKPYKSKGVKSTLTKIERHVTGSLRIIKNFSFNSGSTFVSFGLKHEYANLDNTISTITERTINRIKNFFYMKFRCNDRSSRSILEFRTGISKNIISQNSCGLSGFTIVGNYIEIAQGSYTTMSDYLMPSINFGFKFYFLDNGSFVLFIECEYSLSRNREFFIDYENSKRNIEILESLNTCFGLVFSL